MVGKQPKHINIKKVTVDCGMGGYWIHDQAAVQAGAAPDGFFFDAPVSSPDFPSVRSPSRAYLISIEIDDGQFAYGDCVTVANAGYAGRPLPLKDGDAESIQAALTGALVGRSFQGFTDAAQALDHLDLPACLELPVKYGASQALLNAAALTKRSTLAEVLRHEFSLPRPDTVPGFAGSCGGAWEANVDKAIMRGVAMFPQSAIQTPAECERLPSYAAWITSRIDKWGAAGYKPDLHFDFHSSLGRMYGNDEERVLRYLAQVCEQAKGYTVYFEDPMLSQGTEEAVDRMRSLYEKIEARLPTARLIADEWANGPGNAAKFAAARAAHAIQIKMPDNGSLLSSIDAIQACRRHDVLAYLGGSCNETDISARASVHIALAFGAWRMFTKPGMGFDEGLMIMTNEVSRTLSRS